MFSYSTRLLTPVAAICDPLPLSYRWVVDAAVFDWEAPLNSVVTALGDVLQAGVGLPASSLLSGSALRDQLVAQSLQLALALFSSNSCSRDHVVRAWMGKRQPVLC